MLTSTSFASGDFEDVTIASMNGQLGAPPRQCGQAHFDKRCRCNSELSQERAFLYQVERSDIVPEDGSTLAPWLRKDVTEHNSCRQERVMDLRTKRLLLRFFGS